MEKPADSNKNIKPDNKPTEQSNGQTINDAGPQANNAPGDEAKTDYKIKESGTSFLNSIKKYILDVANLDDNTTDIQGTIDGVKSDIYFKGHKLWILVLSIFICSIGLKINSGAVIIGAMLISPLMGPIVGVGLSLGTNDFQTLITSAKNLGVAVAFAVASSFLFFWLTPGKTYESELLARTTPTLYDVLVAAFGGFAGIIAGSRKMKTNVIPGVAIATALMPPLCTAGFGLATGNMRFFLGAFYLFSINSVFISLSTLIVVRLLKFPVIAFISPQREKRVKMLIFAISFIMTVPAVFIGYFTIKASMFKSKAELFIDQNILYDKTYLIKSKYEYHNSGSVIELTLSGQKLPDDVISALEKRLIHYDLTNTTLKVYQGSGETADINELKRLNTEMKAELMQEFYNRSEQTIQDKEKEIKQLEREIAKVTLSEVEPHQLAKEIKISFPEIKSFGFSKSVITNIEENESDTVPTLIIEHYQGEEVKNKTFLRDWVKTRLKLRNVNIVFKN